MMKPNKTTTKTIYRLLNKSEFDKYRNLWLECLKTFPDNFGPSYDEEFKNETLKFSHLFNKTETADFVFGAFHGEELIGMCGFITEKMFKTRHRGHITQMFVKENFGGQGIGGNLLQRSIELAFSNPIIEQITLTVVATNNRAISAYKKLGFKQYGILEDCIKNPNGYVADLFMVLSKADYKNTTRI